VARGDLLLTIQSNESLKSYNVVSPIDGVISHRNVNSGEQSGDRLLLRGFAPIPSKLTLA
ncbi:MAG: hypothetical protein KUG63_03530, partial [Cycloclasticus sp.]|nr:hypothetical protein [Cycloclasticus sp.]